MTLDFYLALTGDILNSYSNICGGESVTEKINLF